MSIFIPNTRNGPDMKLFTAFAVLAGISTSSLAYAQDGRWKEMALVDLYNTQLPENLSTWKDLLAASDKIARTRFGSITSKTGHSSALIRWHTFQDNDATITVSIFFGSAANCDNGANSNASTQTWSVCPARVTVTKGGQVKSTQTTACLNGFPDGPSLETAVPSPDEKTLVAYDSATSRIQFKAETRGKDAPGCTKSVRIN